MGLIRCSSWGDEAEEYHGGCYIESLIWLKDIFIKGKSKFNFLYRVSVLDFDNVFERILGLLI